MTVSESLMMGHRSKTVTPQTTDSEEGEVFTDGDFEDSDEDVSLNKTVVPVNETLNLVIRKSEADFRNSVCDEQNNNIEDFKMVDGQSNGVNNHSNGIASDSNSGDSATDVRRSSHEEYTPSIVGIIGNQHNHAEQRLAARRAARAEAREIRMRELERQQREQEDHADKAYDMYAETVGRRAPTRLTGLSPGGLHSPRRSSEDSVDDGFCLKDLRHEVKEYEEKFRRAMILNAQLDNDKASLAYQLELLKDRIHELQQEHAQLQREHKDKCSAHERLKRDNASLERDLADARLGLQAREQAATDAGLAFVEAEGGELAGFGTLPALALVSRENHDALADAGEGTLDVRLQNLLNTKQSLESEVRKLKLQLNEERSARHNGVDDDVQYETEMELMRRSVSEAKARAARAEAEVAMQAAGLARMEAQLARLRVEGERRDEAESALMQERRKLQRETREALNRVEELETENNHLTKRLDKLKNAKSALLKDL